MHSGETIEPAPESKPDGFTRIWNLAGEFSSDFLGKNDTVLTPRGIVKVYRRVLPLGTPYDINLKFNNSGNWLIGERGTLRVTSCSLDRDGMKELSLQNGIGDRQQKIIDLTNFPILDEEQTALVRRTLAAGLADKLGA